MIAETSVNLDIGQVVVGVAAIVGALGVPSILAARSSSKTAKKVDTGNGKDLGVTVHEIYQTVEALSAQVHTNTKELLDNSEKITSIEDKLDSHLVISARNTESYVHDVAKLQEHIDLSNQIHERLLKEHGLEDRRKEPRGGD